MVTIQTKVSGEVEVSDKQRILFADGILGFPGIAEYYLLDMDYGPFYQLQAASERDIAFILIRPDVFLVNYDFKIPGDDLDALEIASKEDILDFAIVTIPDNPEQMTANLQGPLIINKHTRKARQIISLNSEYTTKHLILPGIQEKCARGT